MTFKTLSVEEIKEKLLQIPDIWITHGKTNYMKDYTSLFDFIKGLNLDKKLCTNLKEVETPYNSSILHFILYYTAYPNLAFVLSIRNTIIFVAFTGRNHNKLMISLAFFSDFKSALNDLNSLFLIKEFRNLIDKLKIRDILLRDIDDDFVNLVRDKKDKYVFKIASLKELKYSIYGIDEVLELSGSKFANLRWHLNKFSKGGYKVEVKKLKDNVKPVIHLIGKWRSRAVKSRGFSFADTRSDKLAAKLLSISKEFFKTGGVVGPESVISRVLQIDGKIASFNLGFPLGIYAKQNVFAHTVGISDLSIPHLAEYAQYDFWREIKKEGYKYVNDGPSWRDSLKIYKNKFRPLSKKRYYWSKLSLIF